MEEKNDFSVSLAEEGFKLLLWKEYEKNPEAFERVVIKDSIIEEIKLKYDQIYFQLKTLSAFDQKNEGICFAYACSTAIFLALSRIYGRQIYSFNSIFEQIVTWFSPEHDQGAYTDQVLKRECPRYGLKYKELNCEEALKFLKKGVSSVAMFFLPKKGWIKFSAFFNNKQNKERILKKNDLLQEDGKYGNENEEGSGSHVVVLVGSGKGYLEFLNSWGPDWGNNGRFRIDSEKDVFPILKFYPVFWTNDDLTKEEKEFYKKCKEAEYYAFQNKDKDAQRFSAFYFRCKYCYKLIRNDTINIASKEYTCPYCHEIFKPSESGSFRGHLDDKK